MEKNHESETRLCCRHSRAHHKRLALGRETVAEQADGAVTSEDLQASYAAFNARYWNNALPVDPVIEFSEDVPANDIAETGQQVDGRWNIRFNRTYVKGLRIANTVLLHEMAHVACPRHHHDEVWQAEMERLNRMGAFADVLIDRSER